MEMGSSEAGEGPPLMSQVGLRVLDTEFRLLHTGSASSKMEAI